MTTVPVIGITTHSVNVLPGVLDGQPAGFVVGQAYVRALAAAGALAWPIPLIPDDPDLLSSLVALIDGLLIPGGTDLEPGTYGHPPHRSDGSHDPARDRTELALIRTAIEGGVPVLGICRGMQALNVAAGGTLHQHVEGDVRHDLYDDGIPRTLIAHAVHMEGDSHVRRSVGTDDLPVNSLHHQAVRELGSGFSPTAYAPDGLVEAMELPGHPYAVGVQWHPEELVGADERMLRLFVDFVRAAVEQRSLVRTGR